MLTVCSVSFLFSKNPNSLCNKLSVSDRTLKLNDTFTIKFPPYPFIGILFSSLKLSINSLLNVVGIVFVCPEQVSSNVVLSLNINLADSSKLIFSCFAYFSINLPISLLSPLIVVSTFPFLHLQYFLGPKVLKKSYGFILPFSSTLS